jgi:hypothetical protein
MNNPFIPFHIDAAWWSCAAIKAADQRILLDEAEALLHEPPRPWGIDGQPLAVDIQCWSPSRAREEWRRRLRASSAMAAARAAWAERHRRLGEELALLAELGES